MKRIGVLTFYYKNYNCGGLLQAFALQKVIDSIDGYSSEQICFIRDRKKLYLRKMQEFVSDPSQIAYMLKVRANEKLNASQRKSDLSIRNSLEKYDAFMDSIPHSMVVNSGTSRNLNEIYDAFVVGSDQVWNPVYVPMDFFLNFVDKKNPMLSYAASIRVNRFREKEGKRIKELLDRFSYISVREKKGVDLLRSIGVKKEIEVMPDPTLMLEKSEWDKVKKVPEIKDKYIFVYLVVNPEALVHIREYAVKNKFKVVWVNRPEYYFEADDTFIKIESGIGPREFIGLIENSEINIIDSFHGAVFSIIYNRPFYVYGSLFGDDRKKTLLEMTGLTDRCIPYSFDFSEVKLDIEYSIINQLLADNRKQNLDKLVGAIQSFIPVRHSQIDRSVKLMIPLEYCTGCGVCAASCSVEAITLKPQQDGFLYPDVDSEKCVNCGKCSSVCPTTKQFASSALPTGYSFSLNNRRELRTCSSGGIATAMAKNVLLSSGIVYAVRYSSDNYNICFDRFTNAFDVKYIKGTKYSESLPPDYKSILADVKSDTKVLMIGLPCQIAALQSFLHQKQYENLICVSLVCQGKASLALYHKFIEELEADAKCNVKKINMRWKRKDKSANWLAVKFENGQFLEKPLDTTPYGMLCHKVLRPSCYNCKFKMNNSPSDIQIGDFWGSEHLPKDIQNPMGLSCVIAYNEKGRCFLEMITGGKLSECSVDTIVSGNGAIVKSERICRNYYQLANSIGHYNLRRVCDMYIGRTAELKTKVKTFVKTNVSSETTAKIRRIKKRLKG